VILLPNTTSKLQVVTASTGTAEIYACYIDASSTTLVPSGGGVGQIEPTTATTTDLVGSPGASTFRNVKTINIRNSHASNANTYSVQVADSGGLTITLNSVVLAAGEMLTYVEGMGWSIIGADGAYKASTPRLLFKVLSADDAGGTAGTGAQAWFPTAGGVTIVANTTYFFEGVHSLIAGATSTVVSNLFAGTATVSNILYEIIASNAANNTQAAPTHTTADVATAIAVGATGTGVNKRMAVQGAVRFTTAGTFIPQFQFSINPTGTITIKRNSFFRMWPIGDNTVTSVGTWA
jgi:hypothetical protein